MRGAVSQFQEVYVYRSKRCSFTGSTGVALQVQAYSVRGVGLQVRNVALQVKRCRFTGSRGVGLQVREV